MLNIYDLLTTKKTQKYYVNQTPSDSSKTPLHFILIFNNLLFKSTSRHNQINFKHNQENFKKIFSPIFSPLGATLQSLTKRNYL